MFVQTQAVQITENTYPLALACLGAEISGLPADDVLGGYLVINQLTGSMAQYRGAGYRNYGRNTEVTLTNLFLEKADFETRYKFVGAGAPPKEPKLRNVKMIALPAPKSRPIYVGDDMVDDSAQPDD